MVISALFALVVMAAVVAVARRRLRRSSLRRAGRTRAGASPALAIYVRSFSEIDHHLNGRWCHCGGFLERTGEGTREATGRRLRIARLRCQECEDPTEVFFDTTEIMH